AAEEALERRRERRHRGELGQRLREQVRQAPEVDARSRADVLDARQEPLARRRERRVVLHLDDGGHASVQRARRAGVPAFLVRQARIAEVHVDVDEPGDRRETGGVEDRSARAAQARADLAHDAGLDPHVERDGVRTGRIAPRAAHEEAGSALHDRTRQALRFTATTVMSSSRLPPANSSAACTSASVSSRAPPPAPAQFSMTVRTPDSSNSLSGSTAERASTNPSVYATRTSPGASSIAAPSVYSNSSIMPSAGPLPLIVSIVRVAARQTSGGVWPALIPWTVPSCANTPVKRVRNRPSSMRGPMSWFTMVTTAAGSSSTRR